MISYLPFVVIPECTTRLVVNIITVDSIHIFMRALYIEKYLGDYFERAAARSK